MADPGAGRALAVGVLALQGGFEAHLDTLRRLGAEAREVRAPADMDDLDALVVPGGESTTIGKLIASAALEPALRAHHEAGRPILGTCAGLIVCDAGHLGFIDAEAKRNAFGRQLQSFEADLEVAGAGDEPLRAVFIRAPWVESRGPEVEVLASYEGHPVARAPRSSRESSRPGWNRRFARITRPVGRSSAPAPE